MSTFRFVLAEKPSVAKSIAAVLNATKREDGFIIGGNYIISWCAGHLLELAAPEAYGDYAKWRYADLHIILKEPFYMPMIDFDNFTASGEKLKDKTAAPPKLYDLTALQREANVCSDSRRRKRLNTRRACTNAKS